MTLLEVLPEFRDRLIVVGTAVRKPLPVLKVYLDSLDWQELPTKTVIQYVFAPDYPDPKDDALLYLKEWVKARNGTLLPSGPTVLNDFSDQHPQTHQWSANAMKRVGANKNKILAKALHLRADYVFLADADLVLDRTTVSCLLAADRPIACAVYWTHWQRPVAGQTHYAGPQVWLRHPYALDGRGQDEAEFRRHLLDREPTQVWGQGACTLIHKSVLEAGVNFSTLPDLPTEGMWQGEDRHFCVQAERKHIPMWAEPWPDIFHLYHPSDVAKIPEMVTRLGTPHPEKPSLGDLVNLVVTPLEGFPQPNGQSLMTGPQFVRGRLGGLPVVPELEQAVFGLTRGQSAIIPIHFPISYPVPQMRGTRRMIRLTLVDCKPYGFAPVVEEEMRVGMDTATLTPPQLEAVRG